MWIIKVHPVDVVTGTRFLEEIQGIIHLFVYFWKSFVLNNIHDFFIYLSYHVSVITIPYFLSHMANFDLHKIVFPSGVNPKICFFLCLYPNCRSYYYCIRLCPSEARNYETI